MEAARILLVEDQSAFAQGLRSLLFAEAPEGSQEIQIANDGLEAMVACEAFAPHLVLMDIRLPGRSGIATTADIKAMFPSAVVVMLTSSEEEEDLLSALKAGASGYLLKTLEIEEIAQSILSILQGNLVIPAHLAGAIHDTFRDSPPELELGLTEFEELILTFVGRGLQNDITARELGIEPEEVSRHISNIYSKLHITSRAEAMIEALQRGLLD